MKKNNIKTYIIYFAILATIIFLIFTMFNQKSEEKALTYDEMVSRFSEVIEKPTDSNGDGVIDENDTPLKVRRIYGYVRNINDYTVVLFESEEDWNKYFDNNKKNDKELNGKIQTVTLADEEYIDFFGTNTGYLTSKLYSIEQGLKSQGVDSTFKTSTASVKKQSVFMQYLPTIILVGIVLIAMFFLFRSQGNGKMSGFGKSKAVQTTVKNVTFDDVAGADEEKEELKEVVEYLRNPSRFTQLGAKIPRGVLLVGPPGTGKTLLAKAVAGEAGVPFFSMSGSDFVELYVGVGASRVRDLFEQARKTPAAIIFIDEIDAVGRQRGAGLGGGHDEREQTLNQLLVEMDGFGGHSGIIVMAATNRPDILDSALLRPGRFDRQVTIGYPDLEGREAILNVHAKGKPFEETVDMRKIAQTTVGFTGADLANLLNESALLAARNGKTLIGMTEIEDAMIKVTVGTQKKAKKMSEREKRNTAVHEAGHAILAHVLETQDPVRQISIIPSGRALGYTLTPPTEDKYSESKKEMKERIAMMLGGRVAEQIVFDDYTGGASNDIMRATETARKMVTVYGMSDELGTIHFGSNHGSDEVFLGRDFGSTPNYSESTASKIDAEIKKIIKEAYDLAYSTVEKYREKLDFVTEFLLKYEIMDDEQFALAMTDGVTMEQVENLVTEKKKRSEEENKRRKEKLEEEKRKELEERRQLEEQLGLLDDEDENGLIEGTTKQDSSFNENENSLENNDNTQNEELTSNFDNETCGDNNDTETQQ